MTSATKIGCAVGSKIASVLAILLASIIGVTSFTLLYLKFVNFDPGCTDFTSFHSIAFRALPDFFNKGQIDIQLLSAILIAPATVVLNLIFKLFNSYLIVILYSVIFSSLTVYVYFLIARTVIKSDAWALLLTFSLAIHPIFDTYATLGYKPEILGNFAMLAAISVYLNKNRNMFYLWIVVAMLAKIEYIPVCLLLGVWLWVFERNRVYGKGAVTISVFYTMLLVLIASIAVAFSRKLPISSSLGGTLTPIISSFTANPDKAIFNILAGSVHPKALKILILTLPLLLLPYIEPIPLFLPASIQILGSLATWRIFVSSSTTVDFLEQSPPLVAFMLEGPRVMIAWLPFVYFAGARGLKKILDRINSRLARALISISVVISSIFSYYYFIPPFMGSWPFTAYWDSTRYQADQHTKLLASELKMLDVPELRVALSFPLEIYLNRRDMQNIYGIPPSSSGLYQRVLVDLYLCPGFPPREEILEWVSKSVKGPYSVQLFQDGIIVMSPGEPSLKNLGVAEFIERNRSVLNRCFFDHREYERRVDQK